jgi:histone-lysine N-methyltransferase SETMAR
MNTKIDNPADCEVRSAIHFLYAQNVLLVEVMQRGTTINAESYCATLRRLRYAIQNRRRGLLSSGVMHVHDNARLHDAARTQAMLQEFGWEVFERPAYSPDLVPSDFHLFPKLKEFLGGRRFKSDEEVKDAVKEWLNGLAAEVYDEGIVSCSHDWTSASICMVTTLKSRLI